MGHPDKLADQIAGRQRVADELNEGLARLEGLQTPKLLEGATNVYYVYGMILDTEALGLGPLIVVAEHQASLHLSADAPERRRRQYPLRGTADT